MSSPSPPDETPEDDHRTSGALHPSRSPHDLYKYLSGDGAVLRLVGIRKTTYALLILLYDTHLFILLYSILKVILLARITRS